MRWNRLLILPAICSAISCQAVEVNWSSACDFMEASLTLQYENSDHPDIVTLNVTLNEVAATRMESVSRASLHQKMTLIINGRPISTATIQDVLGAKFQVPLSRHLAQELMPTLLAESKGTCKAGD